MRQIRKDLKPFDMACLSELRRLRQNIFWGFGPNKSFWDELECILHTNSKSYEWERMENDEVVQGQIWKQLIGEFYYKHTVHRFEYLYVESCGLAIAEHGHEEPWHDGKQIRKKKEWYIFHDGTMRMCKKGYTHKLINSCDKPIYVISLTISSRATN